MVGVKGAGGPIPKRSDQRRRVNVPRIATTKAVVAKSTVVPKPDPSWHPVAKRWFASLKTSGQAQFYTQSDWSTAVVAADLLSRQISSETPSAAMMQVWVSLNTLLLATEGDRRRASLELQFPKPALSGGGDVSWLDDARRRFNSTG